MGYLCEEGKCGSKFITNEISLSDNYGLLGSLRRLESLLKRQYIEKMEIKNMIPKKLWKDKTLYQSEKLVEIYKQKLIDLFLYEKAKNAKEHGQGAVGGQDREVTYQHFSERFLASATRLQYILLNPNEEFNTISKDLQVTFSSGKISILDIPSGTGAGILSLLCNIAELRIDSKLPRLPLYIDIVGGDYSPSALVIYKELLDDIKDYLSQQFIFIEYKVIEWDASNNLSTNKLLKEWTHNNECEEFYILMSAFSGVKEPTYSKFKNSFEFIQNFTLNLVTTTIYIEPASNDSKRFFKFITKFMNIFEKWFEKETAITKSRFYWYDVIRENPKAKSTVSITLYKRNEIDE